MSLALAILAVSCTKQETPGEESGTSAVITVKESDLKIPAKGGTARIVFETNVPFEVTVDKDWCEKSVSGNTVTFTAAANESFNARYAKAVVKAGPKTLNFTIQQFGFYSSGFEPEDIVTSKESAVFDFPYEFDDLIEAETDSDWITLTISEDNLKVEISENTNPGTPDNPARTAEISWKLGFETGIIKVSQRNISFMTPDANWNVNYEGIQDYKGEDASAISNTVADATISGKYAIYYTTKSVFTDSGMEMDDFVMEVGDALREELFAVIEYYASLGYSLEFSDFLYEESDYEIFDPIENGEYIAYAIGFDDDAKLTGHYAIKEFKVQSGSGGGEDPATGYEAWLGEWEVVRGSKTDTWTIKTKVEGESYEITGIEGLKYPVEALYNSKTDKIEVYAQSGLGILSTSDYGDCEIGLYGGWSKSSFATGNYLIFASKASNGQATLEPGTVSFSDGSSYLLERFQFIASTSDGNYLGVSSEKTPLPVTIKKKGSGSDNPGGDNPGSGSEKYNKFLGSWSVDNGAFEITLSEKTADKSFSMRGWQFDQDFFDPAEVLYEDGNIILMADSNVPFAGNVDIGAEEGPCDMFYVGKFIYTDGKEYYITSDSAYDVATGVLQSDGSIKFSGNKVSLQSGGEFTFNRMEIIAVPISNPEGRIYTFKSKPNEFPLTAVKASGSSVKTLGHRSGTWEKSTMNWFSLNRTVECTEFCQGYEALPKVSVRVRKHIQ